MRWFFANILVLCLLKGEAQLPASIRFTNYTRANGMPEESANSILQDSRGFLWIGSREGLIRFDGLYYKTLYASSGDSTRFSNNNIYVLDEYKPGYVLFMSGTDMWRINIRNRKLERIKNFTNKLVISKPQKLAGKRWFISDSDSVYFTNEELNPVYTFLIKEYFPAKALVSAFPLHYPYCLLSGGTLNRMYLVNYVTRQVVPFNTEGVSLDSRARFLIPQAYDSSHRRLYLSAFFDGNFYCDLQIPQVTSYRLNYIAAQPDGAIRKSVLLPMGWLLQGGDNGLYITDYTRHTVFNDNPVADDPLPSNTIVDIYTGKDGTYWLATPSGISRFILGPSSVNYLQKKLNFAVEDEFRSILKGSDGNIYFLTQVKSLFRFDRKNNTVNRLDSSLNYCWSAVPYGNNIIATGGGKKLMLYNSSTGELSFPGFLQRFFTNNTDLVTLVYKAGNGDLWYSCNGGGGLIRNPAGTNQYIQYKRTSSPPAFSLSYVHTAAEDSQGNIWWGTNKSQLLLKWDASRQRFEEYEVGSLIPQYRFNTGINNLHVDGKDNLWIALDAAAVLKYNVHTKRGDYYDINKGLPTNSVFSMTSDAKNRVWFGTRKGLCCYLPENDKIITFTTLDGFPESNFEGRGILYDREEDLLYIGARRSISYFNPDSLLRKIISTQPPVFIDEILVNGRLYYFNDEKNIRLASRENNIEFSFASPDFQRNDQLLFQYKLKGGSGDWVDLEDKRIVIFNDLSHGRYTLTVRCRYKGTEKWSETTSPFTFIIETPWNKTGWFRLSLAAAFLFLSWLVIRAYYRRKMERQHAIMEKEIAIEQERTKMARELHDGLGSMLSGIKHSFAAMNKEFHLTDQQQLLFHSNLDKLNDSIKELRNISHNMASDALLKYGIENSLRDYCSNMSNSTGIPISYTAIHTENLKLSEEQSFHAFRVMQELLQNIIKHSGASQVLVQLSCNNDLLYIAVEDNGKGFDMQQAKKQKSMGLKNIESRINLLKGHLDYQTSPGKGTSVLITLPCS